MKISASVILAFQLLALNVFVREFHLNISVIVVLIGQTLNSNLESVNA